jgi:hypothetical protein
MRPRCCETASLFSSDQERRLLSFLSAITHSAYRQSSLSPLASAPNRFSPTPYPLARLCVARFPSRWSGLTALRMGGSPPHPSLIPEESIYLPACETFNSGPASRFWFSGLVKSKYGIVFRWKLTPPFQVPSTTFLQPSWSLFQHIPSQQSCNINS